MTRGVMAEVLDAMRDLLLLPAQILGAKRRVDFGVSLRAHVFHERRQVGVLRAAGGAVRQVLGGWRIQRLAAPARRDSSRTGGLLKVACAVSHGLPPKRPRSLRAARNRWTRTVDSFSPVMALTSRGVQSP